MKNLLYILFLVTPVLVFGQPKTTLEMHYLHSKRSVFTYYDPSFKTYDFSDSEINARLKEALVFDQKSNNKKGLGAGLMVAGSALMVAGILYQPKTGIEGLFDFTKPFLITVGAVPLIASVPCFISAGKNKDRMQMKMAEASSLLIK